MTLEERVAALEAKLASMTATMEKVMVASKAANNTGSVSIVGGTQPSVTSGGTVTVYGKNASPLNSSYGGDVHIFAGEAHDGFGEVWLGTTINHPSLGIVPQDMVGLKDGRKLETFAYGGFRMFTKEGDTTHYVEVAEGNQGPWLLIRNGNFYSHFELSAAGEMQINGNVTGYRFSKPIYAPNL